MIIYFSATGNSKYAAEKIAESSGDSIISIPEAIDSKKFRIELKENEPLGFVTPVYFWGLPSIVTEYLSKAEIITNGTHYIYSVMTFGTSSGSASKIIETELKKHGLTLNAKYGVITVDTWTPMFDISDKEKNKKIIEDAKVQINSVIEKINAKTNGDFCKPKGLGLISKIVQKEYEKKRLTDNLKVSDSCIGCGLCAEKCPIHAIEIQNKKPVWILEKCTMCLGCLHRCPEFAISWNNKTEKHGQFTNPDVKL